MNKSRVLGILIVIVAGAFLASTHGVRIFGYRHPPGIMVSEEPIQGGSTGGVWMQGDVQVIARASYDIRARILSYRPYWFLWGRDVESRRYDICVGWGPMSDTETLRKMTIRQSGRFCRLQWRDNSLRSADVSTYFANMHLVPATKEVDRQLKRIGSDDIVRLRGSLVDLKAPTWTAGTSLSRTDSGDGACETMWVEDVIIE